MTSEPVKGFDDGGNSRFDVASFDFGNTVGVMIGCQDDDGNWIWRNHRGYTPNEAMAFGWKIMKLAGKLGAKFPGRP